MRVASHGAPRNFKDSPESAPLAQVPVPLSLTVWCPPDPLSLIVKEPVTEPFTAGLKRTEIAQLFAAGTDPPHALV
jgi:hypothetical protein